MKQTLLLLEKHIGIWLLIFFTSLFAIGGALYYQYALGWEPCVLCIHIRIIMFSILLLSAVLLFLHRFQLVRLGGYISLSVLCGWLFLKSRTLYRVEKGLEDGSCWFSADLPAWFNLEVWLPSLFEVRAACGDSPELLLGVTMADALYYSSMLAVFISFAFTLLSVSKLLQKP